MLQIKNVSKRYVTGSLKQTALDNVSLNLRDNEFVAILGPSGSGKTTLLNLIGGLDRYDSGDLIINGISTKKYKDRDWDSYRNHTIGFVFQSYNLIEHQSILSNVELALTISGIKRKQCREKARKALERVGLGDQLHKRPNQLSGGQMQRVAIARALVNDPDILLADEPTGALDTETSLQVMELLKEVAEDRLVVMVTHNPELALEYATRIVNIRDGKIEGDSNPCDVSEEALKTPEHKNMGKSSMSLFTALSLSFNNLLTKKARTILTSFAGSIGIIGIALILALSNGVNNYIVDIQKSTMASYPILLEAQTMDLSGFLELSNSASSIDELAHNRDAVYSDGTAIELESTITTSITENNLTDFKRYLDDINNEIHNYIGENGIVYSYSPSFCAFTYDPDGVLVNTDGSTLYASKSTQMMNTEAQMYEQMGISSDNSMMFMFGSNNFDELLPGQNDNLISNIIYDNYEIVYGDWPAEYNQVILVLNERNEIPATILYQLGVLPSAEYEEIMKKVDNGEEVKVDSESVSYKDICSKEYTIIPACDFYKEDDNGNYHYIGDNSEDIEELMEEALNLEITGIIRPVEDADNLILNANLCYTRALTDYLIDYTLESDVVKAQKESQEINVLNGLKFAPESDEERIADAKIYIDTIGVSEKARITRDMLTLMYAQNPTAASQMMALGEVELAAMMDSYLQNPEDDVLLSIYDRYISTGDYEDNMKSFGVVSFDAPTSIALYCDSFEDKDSISTCIGDYNKNASEENKIIYTDYVGLLMSSITTIVNVISYVLIAFVGVSLVVSSIMIGIITYISVLERTKEIGILRAIGASKNNISQVFLSETFIVGFCAGLIGIGVTLLTLIPANAIIHAVAGTTIVSAALPLGAGIILVLLSVVLTVIAGVFPALKAAKKDPVTALRTD
ncbi:MAG: ABC transporter ATP-binding protein/permease [Ruminococcaceae bacterium]|nr:ABC transporter ATP-binding protein/permease [Oscillospiraceae bacterium]